MQVVYVYVKIKITITMSRGRIKALKGKLGLTDIYYSYPNI